MDDPSIVLKKLDIIKRHKRIVQDACDLLGTRLIEKGEIEFGIKLISLGYEHDLSKFDKFEREFLIDNEDKETLKLAILKHQAGNKHHVQFWDDIDNMPRLYLAELVCDLFARSTEFGTDLREYIKETFLPQHKINPQGRVYKIIKEFVDLLLDKPFSKV
jgi:hypothetical protein